MTVLLAGFGRFLKFEENPSQIIVNELDHRTLGGHEVVGVVLPVDYESLEAAITSEMRRHQPSLVLGLGLAPGREKITPEKVAVNYKYSEDPDSAGRVARGEPIDFSQPDALFSNLPVETLVERLQSAGMPAALSLSAGAYLCNMAMFVIVREARRRGFGGGFIHLPCHEALASMGRTEYPSMSLQTMTKSIELSVAHYLADGSETPQAPQVSRIERE